MPFRYSGHESFACRYPWLPKAVAALQRDPHALEDDDDAMVALGVGKNMVRSIRFWIRAFGVIEPAGVGYRLTPFGDGVFGAGGLDPYLEDPRTLWLLHWHVSSHRDDPLFAWDFVLSRWPKTEFSAAELVAAAARSLPNDATRVSETTLARHFEVFLQTYIVPDPRRGKHGEDELDCPLAQLRLLEPVADRVRDGRRETVLSIRTDDKPEVSAATFIYCLDDFWTRHRANERTLSFRDIAFAPGGPGAVLKLTEQAVRTRLEAIESDSEGAFTFLDSASVPGVNRAGRPFEPLERVYGQA